MRIAEVLTQAVLVVAPRRLRTSTEIVTCEGCEHVLAWAERLVAEPIASAPEVAALIAVSTLAVRVDDPCAEKLLSAVTGIVDRHCHVGAEEARGMVVSGSVAALGVGMSDMSVRRAIAGWAPMLTDAGMSMLNFRLVVAELASARETGALVRDVEREVATQTIDLVDLAVNQSKPVEATESDDDGNSSSSAGGNGGREFAREETPVEITGESVASEDETQEASIETEQTQVVSGERSDETVVETRDEKPDVKETSNDDEGINETESESSSPEESLTEEQCSALVIALEMSLEESGVLSGPEVDMLHMLSEEQQLEVMCFALTMRSEAFSDNPSQAEVLLTRAYLRHYDLDVLDTATVARIRQLGEDLASYRTTMRDVSQALFKSTTMLEKVLNDMWSEMQQPAVDTRREKQHQHESTLADMLGDAPAIDPELEGMV